MPSQTVKLLAKEIQDLQADPPQGIRVVCGDSDITEFHAFFLGPGMMTRRYLIVSLTWIYFHLCC